MLNGLAVLLLQVQTGLVSYETLAKPLPEILADLSPMVGRQIVCDRALAEDRLCVYVADVEPRELLNKIVFAVAGITKEDDAKITVLPDPRFEENALARRNAALRTLHSEWKKELEVPTNVLREKIDLHELADLLTEDVLVSLPAEGNTVFSRPNQSGNRNIPTSIPDFYDRLQSRAQRNQSWSGMLLRVTATRQYVEANLVFTTAQGGQFFAYSKVFNFSPSSPDSVFNRPVAPDDTTDRRLQFVNLLLRRDHSLLLPTREVSLFAGRPWGDEPLNALTAPALVATAKAQGKDLVAYLDDNAICRMLPPQMFFAYFVIDAYRVDDGEWAVAQVLDPVAARRRRTDRSNLTGLVARAKSRGFFEFWDTAKNRSQAGAANDGTLTLEAASIGPVAVYTLPRWEYVERGARLLSLHQNASLWNRLLTEQGVPARQMSASDRARIAETYSLVRHSLFAKSIDPGVTSTRRVQSDSLGLDKAIPLDSSVRLVAKETLMMVGVHSKREYAAMTNPSHYARTVALVEAGKGQSGDDGFAVLREFVPCVYRGFDLQVRIGDEWMIEGPQIGYYELIDGTEPRPMDKLPKEFREAYEQALAEERKKIGGGS